MQQFVCSWDWKWSHNRLDRVFRRTWSITWPMACGFYTTVRRSMVCFCLKSKGFCTSMRTGFKEWSLGAGSWFHFSLCCLGRVCERAYTVLYRNQCSCTTIPPGYWEDGLLKQALCWGVIWLWRRPLGQWTITSYLHYCMSHGCLSQAG